MAKQKITPTAVPLVEIDKYGAGKEYDFRIHFRDCPIFDMKLDEKGYAGLGDGPELLEKLKDLAFSIVEEKVRRADLGLPITQEDADTLLLLELMKQKFRQGMAQDLLMPGDTPKTYFRRNLEVRFLL